MKEECKDMLVKLYELPDIEDIIHKLRSQDIVIRRALVPEKHIVVDWVKNNFSLGWADECEASFYGHPVTCFVATSKNRLIGIGIYDAISLGVFGPLGLDEHFRGSGIGRALSIKIFSDMRNRGYSYAIVGWLKEEVQLFFKNIVNADVIKNSSPETGMYKGLLFSGQDERSEII